MKDERRWGLGAARGWEGVAPPERHLMWFAVRYARRNFRRSPP